MAQNFTYTVLVQQITSYSVRSDATFVAQIPTFISLAENRLATDFKQQGFQSVVTGMLASEQSMAKPAFWRETIGFWYTDASGVRNPILLRSYEYCRNYSPNPSTTGAPKFYSDYNFQNFFIVPTPDTTYTFELAYYARLQPLDADNQTNWLTLNMPQALLAACMLEAALWQRNASEIAKWQAEYDGHKSAGLGENEERLADRNLVVTKG